MEYGELHDAYNGRICDAQVGESGDLAAARLEEHAAQPSRILSEPLATFPVFVATPASDPRWSAIVAWAIYALQRAELPATPGRRQDSSLSAWRGETSASRTIGPNASSPPPDPTPISMRAISEKGRLSSFHAVRMPLRDRRPVRDARSRIGGVILEFVLSDSSGLRRHFGSHPSVIHDHHVSRSLSRFGSGAVQVKNGRAL